MCNGGGGIFRFIGSTSTLPELEEYFAVGTNLPLKELAAGYGFKYFEATSMETLHKELHQFIHCADMPAILAIYTDPEHSANVLKQYFQLAQENQDVRYQPNCKDPQE